jgi:hypothetical protein
LYWNGAGTLNNWFVPAAIAPVTREQILRQRVFIQLMTPVSFSPVRLVSPARQKRTLFLLEREMEYYYAGILLLR